MTRAGPRSRTRGRSALSQALRRANGARRLGLLLLAHLVLTGLIVARLVTLQAVEAEEYRALGERQLVNQVELPAPRGSLLDRDGDVLALTQQAAAVAANPRVLEEAGLDPALVADALAEPLDRSAEELTDRLARTDTSFVYLGRQLPAAVGERVAERNLPGVQVLDEPSRSYPGGGLAAPVLGFSGIDGEGLSGLEQQLDEALRGTPGSLQVERAPTGEAISAAERVQQPAQPGTDVVLTLDRRVQHRTESALEDALEELDAKGGSAVVLDARSAEVLAMASAPGFDQAEIGEVPAERRRNVPVTDAFEPGSAGKIMTFAAALEHGVVEAGDTLQVPAAVEVGGKRFTDPHRSERADLTLAEMIARSSNVGAIELAEELGDEDLHDALEGFGIGEDPGLDFPGVASGALPATDDWWATSRPTIALGQSYSLTLLQLASATQAIVNDGQRTAPTLVRGQVRDGRFEAADEADSTRAVDPEAAAELARLLTAVVEEGTGQHAAVEGYTVGGKTGTAQKPRPDARGYEPGAYRGVFTGFAPASDPALVVAVMLDEPSPHWGGESAAPVFAEITEAALTARGIAPDDDAPETQDGSQDVPEVRGEVEATEEGPPEETTPEDAPSQDAPPDEDDDATAGG